MDMCSQVNCFTVTERERKKMKEVTLLFAGVDSVSVVVAECALRLGFENIVIVDDSKVSERDVGSMNFALSDVGQYKVDAIKRRLDGILPSANIYALSQSIESVDVGRWAQHHLIAVNSLNGLSTDVSECFDRVCRECAVAVLHIYNLSWAGVVVVVNPFGRRLNDLGHNEGCSRYTVAKQVADYYRFWGAPIGWLEELIEQMGGDEFPQLSVGAWILGGLTANVLFDLAVGNKVKYYPQFYMLTIKTQ